MANVPVHGHAHSDVQLGVTSSARVPADRSGHRACFDGHDPVDERCRNILSLSIQEVDQMVTNGIAGWNTDSGGGMMNASENTLTQPGKGPAVEKLKHDFPIDTVADKSIISIEDVNFYYGAAHALKSINVEIPEKKATAFIGPSGCGKTTLLRC